MISWIIKRQPLTFNSWKTAGKVKKDNYKALLINSLKKYHPRVTMSHDDMYGIAYHFFNTDQRIDADNISKPLWDALKKVTFDDDYQVKIRHAGSFNLTKHGVTVLDFSGLPGRIVVDLLEAFDTEEHVVYIECGKLDFSMFAFNMEK